MLGAPVGYGDPPVGKTPDGGKTPVGPTTAEVLFAEIEGLADAEVVTGDTGAVPSGTDEVLVLLALLIGTPEEPVDPALGGAPPCHTPRQAPVQPGAGYSIPDTVYRNWHWPNPKLKPKQRGRVSQVAWQLASESDEAFKPIVPLNFRPQFKVYT